MILPLFQSVFSPDQTPRMISGILPHWGAYSLSSQLAIISIFVSITFFLKALASVALTYHGRNFSELLRQNWIGDIGRLYLHGKYTSIINEKQGVLLTDWFSETTIAARFYRNFFSYISAIILIIGLVVIGLYAYWARKVRGLARTPSRLSTGNCLQSKIVIQQVSQILKGVFS